jgi:tetratricopeptide (TPR) repeat protein
MRRMFTASIIVLSSLFLPEFLYADKTLNILVYPFTLRGSKKHSWISAGMTDTVISDLGQVKGINVFTEEDRKKAIREIELGMTGIIRDSDIAKVGRIMGANLIFTGAYSVHGERIRVTAKLVTVESSRVEKSIKLDDSLSNIFSLQDRIVTRLLAATKSLRLPGYKSPEFNETEISSDDPGLRAFEYYSRAIEIAESNPRDSLTLVKKALSSNGNYVQALKLAGWISGLQGNQDLAMEYYSKAEKVLITKKMLDSYDYGELLANRGIIYWNKGQNHEALNDYGKAKEIFERIGKSDSSVYASTITNMGSAYRNMGDTARALDLANKGKAVWERIGLHNSTGYAWTLSNIGVIQFVRKEYTNAVSNYARALEIWQTLGLQRSQGYALTTCQLGSVYNQMGQYQKALDYFIRGTELSDSIGTGNTDLQAWYYWYIGSIYFERMNKACSGLPYMKKSVAIFTRLNHHERSRAGQYLERMQNACRR